MNEITLTTMMTMGIPVYPLADRIRGAAQVNAAICTMRERNGLAPISDPLPDERENVSRLIKELPLSRGCGGLIGADADFENQHPNQERSP